MSGWQREGCGEKANGLSHQRHLLSLPRFDLGIAKPHYRFQFQFDHLVAWEHQLHGIVCEGRELEVGGSRVRIHTFST